jgi:nitroreductase
VTIPELIVAREFVLLPLLKIHPMIENLSISQIIRGRRSIFPAMYTGETISDKKVVEIISNATWAPTHKKTEPWRFFVKSGKTKERLKKYAEDWYITNTSKDQYSSIKHKKIKFNLEKASHIIAIVLHRDLAASIPEWEEIAAVSMAVQNMWLTAHELGVGSYWSTPEYALACGDFLGLAPNEKCLGWFYLGDPIQDINPKSSRKDIEEVMTWL